MDFLEIYLSINAFIIGTLFGSFFSLALYRLPKKIDIVFKQSFCPKCEHKLGFFDLIPVLSYTFSGGKCRYCKEKISVRYIGLELFTGFVFLISFLILGLSFNYLVFLTMYIFAFLFCGTKFQKKKGVFITEIVIAVGIFAIFSVSAYTTNKNYMTKLSNEIINNNAFIVLTQEIEKTLIKDYDDIGNVYNRTETINNIVYTTDINYKGIGHDDNLNEYKKIGVTVEYNVNGVVKTITQNAYKKKVQL